MSEIVEKVKELCETISKDSQFIRCQKIVDVFINDKEKNSEYQALLEKQRTLHSKKMDGKLTQDDVDSFDAECERVFALPAVSEFLEAQDALDQLNDLISRYVELTFEFGRVPTQSELEDEIEAEEELAEMHHHGCGDPDCDCEEDCGDNCSCK